MRKLVLDLSVLARRLRGRKLYLALAVVLTGTTAAYAGDLKTEEAAARTTAVRILNALEPIESWVDSVPVSPPDAATPRQIVRTTSSRVNLRTGPTVEAPVLAVAVYGDEFDYIDTEGDWYLIAGTQIRRA